MRTAMLPLIAECHSQIADICRRFGVSRLAVFGSAARGEHFDTARSEVDFLVAGGERRARRLFRAARRVCGGRGPTRRPRRRGQRAQSVRSRRHRAVGGDGLWTPRAYLWDARERADAIASFVRGRTFEDYRADVMLRSAVEHACHLQFIAMATNMKRAAVLIREA